MGNALDVLQHVRSARAGDAGGSERCIITSKQFLRALHYGSRMEIREFDVTMSPDLSQLATFRPEYRDMLKYVPLQQHFIYAAPNFKRYVLLKVSKTEEGQCVLNNKDCSYQHLCDYFAPDFTPETFYEAYKEFSPQVFGIDPAFYDSSLMIAYEWF